MRVRSVLSHHQFEAYISITTGTLLANQASLVKNSFCLRASLISHFFTRVLPMPLPLGHPERKKSCFWAASSRKLRYETQANLIRQLDCVTRHYTAAAFSLRTSRAADSRRLLTMGAIVAVTDAALRIAACDTPSKLSLHYAGNAEALNFDGPKEILRPYGVDMNHFRAESSMFLLCEASLAVVRTQCLDYFQSIHRLLDNDHMMFKWERSMECSAAEKNFMRQLCVQDGFECDGLAAYWVNQKRAVLDLYPELRAFRDISMLLKFMMSPSVEDLPQIHRWQAEDAELTWSFKNVKSGEDVTTTFEVRAFEREIKPSWPEDTYVVFEHEARELQ